MAGNLPAMLQKRTSERFPRLLTRPEQHCFGPRTASGLAERLTQSPRRVVDGRVVEHECFDGDVGRRDAPQSEDPPLRPVVGPPAHPTPSAAPVRIALIEDLQCPCLSGRAIALDHLGGPESAVEQVLGVIEVEQRRFGWDLVALERPFAAGEERHVEHLRRPASEVGEDLSDRAAGFC